MNDPYTTPRRPIDHAAIAEHNAGVLFARLAYEDDTTDICVTCRTEPRVKDKRQCWRCRKDKK